MDIKEIRCDVVVSVRVVLVTCSCGEHTSEPSGYSLLFKKNPALWP
jgi:hypothetical protein